MNIREYSLNLQKLYQEMSETFSHHQISLGLPCLSGCGKCCLNPDIEVSMWEMIPMALEIFDEGGAEEWMDKLQHEPLHCHNLISTNIEGMGHCAHYQSRPSICRMFGVAARVDKLKKINLSVCKHIKEAFPDEYQKAATEARLENTPLFSHWGSRVNSLQPEASPERFPINQALRLALQKVIFSMQYKMI